MEPVPINRIWFPGAIVSAAVANQLVIPAAAG